MEDLTKTQIILLTLLVSFVTSIATGIITTSLLAEAPTNVTQTINRVVERTIEKVTTPDSNGSPSIVREVTIVKEDDAVTKAIEKTSPSIVRINIRDANGSSSFHALGVVISNSGLILTAKNNLIPNASYNVSLSDGATFNASISRQSDKDDIVLFQIESDPSYKNKLAVVSLAANTPKLGQTIILISGKDKNNTYVARVTGLNTRIEKDSKGQNTTITYAVETDVRFSVEISGAPIINLSGELVGVKNSILSDQTVAVGDYTTVLPIKQLIEKVQ